MVLQPGIVAVFGLTVCWQASCCVLADGLPATTGQNEVAPLSVEPARQGPALPHSVQSRLANGHSSSLASKRSARAQHSQQYGTATAPLLPLADRQRRGEARAGARHANTESTVLPACLPFSGVSGAAPDVDGVWCE